MDDAKKQLAEKLKSSNNILVTVSRNPSVDQLASCIALTLLLNKQGKHAAAVFSGKVPSTLEFLQPEATLEKNTDSLRDFIISLDKAKADKLRYKVEDNVVRIFITPYKTSISQDDLEFTQGDFNVDVVVALGVNLQEDLDEAITAHGRILHDATVTSINTNAEGGLGSINWHDPQASSLSELVTDLTQAIDSTLLDSQIATALLTGIISETDRFGNDKTSALTMSASAALLAAGANQQLVATKLEEPLVETNAEPIVSLQGGDGSTSGSDGDQTQANDASKPDDGALRIEHEENSSDDPPSSEGAGEPDQPEDTENKPEAPVSESPPEESPNDSSQSDLTPGPSLMTEPPTLGGELSANSQGGQVDSETSPFQLPETDPPLLLDHKEVTPADVSGDSADDSSTSSAMTPPPPTWTPPPDPTAPPLPDEPMPIDNPENRTLTELEKSVKSPHVVDPDTINEMRDEVSKALTDTVSKTDVEEPIEALNAQPLGPELHEANATSPAAPASPTEAAAPTAPPLATPQEPQVIDPTAPPPVPPPIPFQFGTPPQS